MRHFPDFERKLLALDPKLFLAWDSLAKRWVIFRHAQTSRPFYTVVGGAMQKHESRPYHHILTIQDPNTGEYAEPVGNLANKIIAWLRRYDTYVRSPDSIAQEIDDHNEKVREERERKHGEEMHARNKYYAKLWKEALTGERKGVRPTNGKKTI
jgi:hypothetical protein